MTNARKKKKKSSSEPEKDSANDEKLLKKCVDSVDEWYRCYNEHIQRARNFLTFLYVDQWDLNVRQAREMVSRPVMQFNKLVPVIRSILGEQRENAPAPTVRGLGKDISQNDIDIREGLLRQIQYHSDADIVYQIASKHMLECGWGAARVCTRYENEYSFNQEIYIEPIVDFQCAFWDSTAQLPNKSDGDYCGVYTTFSRERFEEEYPEIENPQSMQPSGNNYYFRWNTRDTITICEKYYKEYYTKNIVQLSDGNVVDKKDSEEIFKRQEAYLVSNPDAEWMGFKPLEIVSEREVRDYKIKYVKFIQNAILEKKDYPGRLLPVVYFNGDSTVIDGENIPLPFIQDAIDNQKLINYLGSELAYAALRSRKETVMGTVDNFKGYEEEWRNPDQVQGPLIYNLDNKAGKPEFIDPPVFNQGILQLYQNASTDLQANLGWFEEAKGNETNAMSGKAVLARQSASKKPVNIYENNWQQGIRQVNKVILDLIPHIYDTERTVMIRMQDNSSKAVDINKPMGFRYDKSGNLRQNVINDMQYGKYDVEVKVGGSYDSQMAEAMDILIRLAAINPAIGNLIPDLIAEVSGLENTQKLVSRLKTLLPPQILAQEEGKPMPPPQPPSPDPMVQIEHEKNQVAMAQNETKLKSLAVEEQKIMMQAQLAGIDRDATYAKAMAEINKSANEKDIAILDHANKISEIHHKSMTTQLNGE